MFVLLHPSDCPCPTVLQTQDTFEVDYHHHRVCAMKGKTVNISATYWHPDWATVQVANWFRQHEDHYRDVRLIPENSGRVTESCDSRNCILTIKYLRESDAVKYWLSFITDRGKYVNTKVPGVTLSLTGKIITTFSARQQQHHCNNSITTSSASHHQCLQYLGCFLIADPRLQISVSRPAGDRGPARLSCDSLCHLTTQPVYIWYRNKQIVSSGQTLYRLRIKAKDRFSCGLSGFRVPSPAVCESKSSSSLNCCSRQI